MTFITSAYEHSQNTLGATVSDVSDLPARQQAHQISGTYYQLWSVHVSQEYYAMPYSILTYTCTGINIACSSVHLRLPHAIQIS